METNISNESMKKIQDAFAHAVGSGRYHFSEFDLFLNDVLRHGMIIMEKIISGNIDEDDLRDIDEVIILSRENMFSEN